MFVFKYKQLFVDRTRAVHPGAVVDLSENPIDASKVGSQIVVAIIKLADNSLTLLQYLSILYFFNVYLYMG